MILVLVQRLVKHANSRQVMDGDVEKWTPCSPGDAGAQEMTWTEVDSDKLLEPPLQLKDFVKAVKGARPTVSQEDIKRSSDWTNEFGSEGA
jgi:vacuolar protein-sorting-associated protein 4